MAVVAERLRFATAPDGRDVAFAVWGDPAGFPVLRLHGTPGCRLMRWPDETVYSSLGICFVTHDRAGHTRSPAQPVSLSEPGRPRRVVRRDGPRERRGFQLAF